LHTIGGPQSLLPRPQQTDREPTEEGSLFSPPLETRHTGRPRLALQYSCTSPSGTPLRGLLLCRRSSNHRGSSALCGQGDGFDLSMKIRRLSTNLLLQPGDVPPSREDFEVIGTFNPGAVRAGDEVVLMVRVAERPRQVRPGYIGL